MRAINVYHYFYLSLLLYCIFKKNALKTEFLDTIENPLHKKCINKFRLGNRKLRIETGRHTVPRPPENLRICSFCHSDEVETYFFLAPFMTKYARKSFSKYMKNTITLLAEIILKILFLCLSINCCFCFCFCDLISCMTRQQSSSEHLETGPSQQPPSRRGTLYQLVLGMKPI